MPSLKNDRAIVAERVFKAPRELVFKVWTDPQHISKWWGPNGFTTTSQIMDVRPGGVWIFTMHGPDGVDYPNRIVYSEIVPPEKIVYTHDSGVDDAPGQFQVTLLFTDEGKNKTKLSIEMLFRSAAERDEVVEKYGAIEGLNQTLSRFEELLSTM
ncbi:SRPBCC domain-containing protein [bacterium]|nr:SRPBCC domain-containing protein [bacterium]